MTMMLTTSLNDFILTKVLFVLLMLLKTSTDKFGIKCRWIYTKMKFERHKSSQLLKLSFWETQLRWKFLANTKTLVFASIDVNRTRSNLLVSAIVLFGLFMKIFKHVVKLKCWIWSEWCGVVPMDEWFVD